MHPSPFPYLLDITVPRWLYVLRATLIAWLPAVLLGVVGWLIHPTTKAVPLPLARMVTLILIQPWIEVTLLVLVIWLLCRWLRKPKLICALAAIPFGFLHMEPVSYGIIGYWVFFVLSYCYLVWLRTTLPRAYLTTICIYMCFNLFVCLTVLLFG